MTTARTIRAYNHKLYSIVINKRGLSAYDDKKYVMENGIDTCSYGHYKLQNQYVGTEFEWCIYYVAYYTVRPHFTRFYEDNYFV